MSAVNGNPEEHGIEFDLGNLLTVDPRPVQVADKTNIEAVIQSEMTTLTKMFFKQLWALPLERVDDTIVAALPKPTTRLPREKPIPKPKPLTKWERFAKEKGIKKVKKSPMVWDEGTKSWKPRFGYGKAQAPEDDWVQEVPDNSDGLEDMWAAKRAAKKERVAKSELQRLKNIARAHKTNVPATGILPQANGHKPSKDQVGMAAAAARFSTASAGAFDQNLPKEKPAKISQGKKRKFEDNFSAGQSEKERLLGILKDVTAKKPRVEGTSGGAGAEGGGPLGRIHRRSAKKPKNKSDGGGGDGKHHKGGGGGGGFGGKMRNNKGGKGGGHKSGPARKMNNKGGKGATRRT